MPFKNTFWHFKWHIKRQDAHTPRPHFWLFCSQYSQSQSTHPFLNIRFVNTGPESHSFLPFPGTCQIRQQSAAVADSWWRRSTERNHCFACEIIVLHKAVYRPCRNAPPDRILNRRSYPLALDFTGLNRIQKCVLCLLPTFIFFETFCEQLVLEVRKNTIKQFSKISFALFT